MSDIATDFRRFLREQESIRGAVNQRVHQNHAPEGFDGEYVWFSRSGHEQMRSLDQAAGEDPCETLFDVEVVGTDLDRVEQLGAAIRRLDSHRGEFGDGRVQGIFVHDQTDDYLPRGLPSDATHLELSALLVRVVGYTAA